MVLGAYTKFRPLTKEDKKVFDLALEGLVGVDYEPLIVATQVVAGTNYKFVCNATIVYPDSIPFLAMVKVFAPLSEGAVPVIMEINRIDD